MITDVNSEDRLVQQTFAERSGFGRGAARGKAVELRWSCSPK
jgi:hypothetical protein